ncbi:MAG: response regulator, partial [Candidatus Aminicenantes bacterium]|nr:response regulator [Candidatus Aminicenantes bacterium]
MKKVLVVDFDVEFLKSVSLMLREEGFEIITAVEGQAGLERFEADKPDLVILEAMLPKLHGFELCARITENQTHTAPVIVITGVYRDALYKTEALRTFGATAYFEKPVDMSRLMEAIQKALSAPAAGAQEAETKKAPAAGEKPPVRPTTGVQ